MKVSFIFWGVLLLGLMQVKQCRAECKGPQTLEVPSRGDAEIARFTELGRWFGEHRQFVCANQAFRSAIRLDPSSAKLHYFLGLSLYSSGQKEAAAAALLQSAKLDPAALQPRLLLASVLHELGRNKEAQQQWKAALKIDPASGDALDGLSKELIAGQDPLAAVALLHDAARDETLTLDLVSAYGEAGMLDDALSIVNEALAKEPASMPLTRALATVYIHQRRYQDAAALMKGFLGQHPDDRDAQIQYLSALVLTSDFAAARPLGEKLLAAAPHDFDVLYLNGVLEREAQEYFVAREHLQEAVKLRPDDYSARYNLGATLARLDQPVSAEAELNRAIAIDGSQPEAHFQLAGVLRRLNKTQAAQEEIALYQKLKLASAGRAEAESKSQQAQQKLAAGDGAQAVSLYRDAVKASPGDALMHYQMAMAMDQTGDASGEREALRQCVAIDPTFALAHNQLGVLDSRGGDVASAESHFRKVVELSPEFVEGWINLSATLASESRFADAKATAAKALALDPKNAQAIELKQQLDLAAH